MFYGLAGPSVHLSSAAARGVSVALDMLETPAEGHKFRWKRRVGGRRSATAFASAW